MSNLIFISCREKEKGLGPISYLRAIIQLSKMVAVKERIALIRAISRENERRRMFSESAQMLIALRRRQIALLLSLAGTLLLSCKENLAWRWFMYDLAGVCSGATAGGRWFGQHILMNDSRKLSEFRRIHSVLF